LFTNDYILTTFIKDAVYTSAAIDDAGVSHSLPLIALKEKCVFDTQNTNYIWCAAPTEQTDPSFVEDWYKGTVTSQDNLWLINILAQTAQLYANPNSLVGRTIDVTSIDTNAVGDTLTFTNKIDHTLWLYDLSVE